MVETDEETQAQIEKEFGDYPALREFYIETIPRVDGGIERFFDTMGSPEFLARIGEDPDTFKKAKWTPAYKAVVEGGGKRVRPLLVYLAHDLVKGTEQPYRHLDDLATIVELIHKGTIVNDDIADKTLRRNGKPTLHKRYGIRIAQNVGNFLYFIHTHYFKNPDLFLGNGDNVSVVPVGEEKKAQLREAIEEELEIMHRGQADDLWWGVGGMLRANRRLPTEDQYNKMAGAKSSYPLAMREGGILGGASEEQQDCLRQVGQDAGLSFQIKDDRMELDPNDPGYGGDIRERKATLPVIHTLNSGTQYADELREVLIHKSAKKGKLERKRKFRQRRERERKETIDSAVEIMNLNNSIRHADRSAQEYADRAIGLLKDIFPDTYARQVTAELIRYGVSRTQ